MKYLIIGAIVALLGIVLLRNDVAALKYLGIVIMLIGGGIGLKGRRALDKDKA